MPVTITSKGSDGSTTKVTITKTGKSKGTIRIKKFGKGKNPNKDKPNDDDTYELYNIKSKKNGSKITAKADVTGSDPVVTITINCPPPPKDKTKPKKKPTVTIKVKGSWSDPKPRTLTISEKDQDAIIAFLKKSKFPVLAFAGDFGNGALAGLVDQPGTLARANLRRLSLSLADVADSLWVDDDDWLETDGGLAYVGFDPGIEVRLTPVDDGRTELSLRCAVLDGVRTDSRLTFRDGFIRPDRPETADALTGGSEASLRLPSYLADAVDARFERGTLDAVLDAPASAIQGVGPTTSSALAAIRIDTVRHLAQWPAAAAAARIVALADTGAPLLQADDADLVDKAFEQQQPAELVHAPVSALQGIGVNSSGVLIELGIESVGALGTWTPARKARDLIAFAGGRGTRDMAELLSPALPPGASFATRSGVALRHCEAYRAWRNTTDRASTRTVNVYPSAGGQFPGNGTVTVFVAPDNHSESDQPGEGPPKDSDPTTVSQDGDSIAKDVPAGHAVFVHFNQDSSGQNATTADIGTEP